VRDGVADIAIIGSNTEYEKNVGNHIVMPLGFSRCRVSLAVPRDVQYSGPEYFNGKKIATSYPRTLQVFLDEKGIDAQIHCISGSVEIAPGIGLADGICDIVSSGSTLLKNGLKETDRVLESEAVLVATPSLPTEKQELLDRLVFRIKSVLSARNNKYIMLNAPASALDNICDILPGKKSPTVMPLQKEGWVSIHSVVSESKFWEVIGSLKDAGAEDILVLPIEKMIF
jgi:ATP phosphoribosyltransferase